MTDAIDGTTHDYGLLMGISTTDTARWAEFSRRHGFDFQPPEIPEMPDLSDAGPVFVFIDEKSDSPAVHILEQLHDLYRNEGRRMEAAYHAREKARAERKAYLLSNPPVPADITTWITQPRRSLRNAGGR